MQYIVQTCNCQIFVLCYVTCLVSGSNKCMIEKFLKEFFKSIPPLATVCVCANRLNSLAFDDSQSRKETEFKIEYGCLETCNLDQSLKKRLIHAFPRTIAQIEWNRINQFHFLHW